MQTVPEFNESAEHRAVEILPIDRMSTEEKIDRIYAIVSQFDDLLAAIKPEDIKKQMENPMAKAIISMFTKNLG
jgi:hypothetical protein